jgi:hypothetical protein
VLLAQPNLFSDLDPLVLSGLAVLSAQALYYAVHWFIGDRSQKEKAMEGFEHVILSGVLFGLALALVNLAIWGLNVYLDLAGIEPLPGGSIETLSRTSGWQDFGSNVQAALKVAEDVYRFFVKAAGVVLGAYLTAVTVTGLLPWTSSISTAIAKTLAFLISAATTIILSAGAYAVATVLARTWPVLLPIGAVLVTYERTRYLGAWLVAVSVVAPIVLAAGADVLTYAVAARVEEQLWGMLTDPIKILNLIFMTLNPGPAMIDLFGFIVDLLLMSMVLLSLIGLTLGVLVYAVSRLFDHAGASLSLD